MKAKPTLISLGILVTTALIAFFAFALLIPNTFGFWGCQFRAHVLSRNLQNRDKLRSLLYELDAVSYTHLTLPTILRV